MDPQSLRVHESAKSHTHLVEDHANAKLFAKGLQDIKGIQINPKDVETNIIIFSLSEMSSHEFTDRLSEQDTHMLPWDDSSVRAVTNLMVKEDQIIKALEQIRSVL